MTLPEFEQLMETLSTLSGPVYHYHGGEYFPVETIHKDFFICRTEDYVEQFVYYHQVAYQNIDEFKDTFTVNVTLSLVDYLKVGKRSV